MTFLFMVDLIWKILVTMAIFWLISRSLRLEDRIVQEIIVNKDKGGH